MATTFTLCFVTGNASKRREIIEIYQKYLTESSPCDPVALKLVFEKVPDLPEIQEIDTENVVELKTKIAHDYLHHQGKLNTMIRPIVIVDDTGFYAKSIKKEGVRIKFKNGFPGALIKSWMESIEGDSCLATCQLFGGGFADVQTSFGIYYKTYQHAVYHVVSGRMTGLVPHEPKYGENSKRFGWDPCFAPVSIMGQSNLEEITYDQITPEIKNGMSMRYIAFQKLVMWIRTNLAVLD